MDALCAFLLRQRKRRLAVSVAGGAGAGKTTFAMALVARLNELQQRECAVCVPMDGFHLPKAHLERLPNREEAFLRRGIVWSFDVDALLAVARHVCEHVDEVTRVPGWDHAVGDPLADALAVLPSHEIVVFEGLYLHLDEPGWREIYGLMDVHVFLSCDKTVAMERVSQRHVECGIAHSKEDADARVARNDSLNYDLVQQRSMPAEIVIDTSTSEYRIVTMPPP